MNPVRWCDIKCLIARTLAGITERATPSCVKKTIGQGGNLVNKSQRKPLVQEKLKSNSPKQFEWKIRLQDDEATMGRNGPKSEVKVVANQRDWELLLEEQVLIQKVSL